MTVVLYMDKCIFCGTGHYTDQECNEDNGIRK